MTPGSVDDRPPRPIPNVNQYFNPRGTRPEGPPYLGWQEHLLAAFHELQPEKGGDGRRYKPGTVARAVMLKANEESYVVTAEYDINSNQNAVINSWYRVVEALIRDTRPNFQRCPITKEPKEYDSGRLKAGCGIRIRIKISTAARVARL